MIIVTSVGSFDKTTAFLNTMKSRTLFRSLDHYGRMGVDALSRATPRDTGLAASSWSYRVGHTSDSHFINWINTDLEGGRNVAVMIQYGHGTGTGGYIAGRDYINPAMRPIFDKAVDDIWRQVTNA